MLRALNVVKRFRGQAGNLDFSDTLYLAANEQAEDICNNGAVGSVGSDGRTLPYDRVKQYGNAIGLEDYIVSGVNGGLDVVMKLLLKGDAKNLRNEFMKKAAVASCAKDDENVFVVYLAENVVANALA